MRQWVLKPMLWLCMATVSVASYNDDHSFLDKWGLVPPNLKTFRGCDKTTPWHFGAAPHAVGAVTSYDAFMSVLDAATDKRVWQSIHDTLEHRQLFYDGLPLYVEVNWDASNPYLAEVYVCDHYVSNNLLPAQNYELLRSCNVNLTLVSDLRLQTSDCNETAFPQATCVCSDGNVSMNLSSAGNGTCFDTCYRNIGSSCKFLVYNNSVVQSSAPSPAPTFAPTLGPTTSVQGSGYPNNFSLTTCHELTPTGNVAELLITNQCHRISLDTLSETLTSETSPNPYWCYAGGLSNVSNWTSTINTNWSFPAAWSEDVSVLVYDDIVSELGWTGPGMSTPCFCDGLRNRWVPDWNVVGTRHSNETNDYVLGPRDYWSDYASNQGRRWLYLYNGQGPLYEESPTNNPELLPRRINTTNGFYFMPTADQCDAMVGCQARRMQTIMVSRDTYNQNFVWNTNQVPTAAPTNLPTLAPGTTTTSTPTANPPTDTPSANPPTEPPTGLPTEPPTGLPTTGAPGYRRVRRSTEFTQMTVCEWCNVGGTTVTSDGPANVWINPDVYPPGFGNTSRVGDVSGPIKWVNVAYLNILLGSRTSWSTVLSKGTSEAAGRSDVEQAIRWTPWVNVTCSGILPSCCGVVKPDATSVALTYYGNWTDWMNSLDSNTSHVLNNLTTLKAFVGNGPKLFPHIQLQSVTPPPYTVINESVASDTIIFLYAQVLFTAFKNKLENGVSNGPLYYFYGIHDANNNTALFMVDIVWTENVEMLNNDSVCMSYLDYLPACNQVPTVEVCEATPLCMLRNTMSPTPQTSTMAPVTLPPTRPPSPGKSFVQVDRAVTYGLVGVVGGLAISMLVVALVWLRYNKWSPETEESEELVPVMMSEDGQAYRQNTYQ